jgi:hypothetical protein
MFYWIFQPNESKNTSVGRPIHPSDSQKVPNTGTTIKYDMDHCINTMYLAFDEIFKEFYDLYNKDAPVRRGIVPGNVTGKCKNNIFFC